tara:strand:- start:659 stop:967 length:309 start_codon:yes stop_codon:yes gene_type:complete
MKKICYIIFVFIFFAACGGFKDAAKVLRNEKVRTTDEFLVEKKEPLVLPPDYDVIPEPGSISEEKASEEKKIKKLLKSNNNVSNNTNNTTSTEESILEKIRK